MWVLHQITIFYKFEDSEVFYKTITFQFLFEASKSSDGLVH